MVIGALVRGVMMVSSLKVGVRLTCMMALVLSVALTACQKNDTPAQTTDPQVSSLVGCYTISRDEPAQIKINQTADGFSMQMQTLKANRAWDNPEPLQVLDIASGWRYFQVNTLDFNKEDVEQIIARPDGVMALAKLQDTAMNVNPRLDSPYVMYIVQGSNTVYQVPCD